MSVSTKCRKSRATLLTGLLLLVASTSLAQSELRKWMPNVGDLFVYDRKWQETTPAGDISSGRDTTQVVIEEVDIARDSSNNHVVHARGKDYSFDQGSSPGTGVPIIVRGTASYFDYELNFSYRNPKFAPFGSDSLLVVDAESQLGGFPRSPVINAWLSYSPKLRWFKEDGYYSDDSHGKVDYEIYSLLAAVSSISKVSRSVPSTGSVVVNTDGETLDVRLELPFGSQAVLTLIDPIARPIRSWSLDVAAGESQVHLNVADVSSGVYFLKLSAPGNEQVRKVVIAH